MFKNDPRYTSEMIVNTLIPYRSRQIRFYNQRAYKYLSMPYGTKLMSRSGCGPFACAIAASSLLGRMITPEYAAHWALKNNLLDETGTSREMISAFSKHVGLSCEDMAFDLEKMEHYIRSHHALAILLCRSGSFARGNHYVVVGVKGKHLKVYNSANVLDCYKRFTLSDLEAALVSRDIGIGPVWYLTTDSGDYRNVCQN